jgi:formyl-CoA transferase
MAVNHNKRSLALDLKTQAGQQILHELVQNADVVLQGFGGGTAAKLKVDYATLSALNPKLIYCEISGYGRAGPLGDEPGYDVMLQAFSGMISTMGAPSGEFARASFSPVDMGTGMFGLSGVLAALLERGRTGKGVYLELSLLDTSLGFLTYMAQSYWQSGADPKPMGTGHPSMCPYQVFETADQPIMLGAGNDAQWRRFCSVAGLEEYVDRPDLATNALRVKNMSTKTLAQWLECLSKNGVPAAPIHKLSEALAHPQVAARGLIVQTEHPTVGSLKQIGLPIKFQDEDRRTHRPPPLLGEHSQEVLSELGYTADAIQALRTAGVIQ